MSPPSRAVLLTAKALDLTFELHEIDTQKDQQLTSEFLQVGVLPV